MTEQTQKRNIQVFPRPDWIAESSCNCNSSSNCGPGASCHGPSESLDEMLAKFMAKHAGTVEVNIAKYSDGEIAGSINALNKVLETSQEEVRIDRGIFDLFMGHYAPLIAIDSKLAFVGGVPSSVQMEKALATIPAPIV